MYSRTTPCWINRALSAADYVKDVKKYPTLDTENIYVLNSISSAENNRLNSIFGKSIIAVATIENKGLSSFGIPVPAGESDFDYLQTHPETLNMIKQALATQVAALPSSTVTQTSASYLKVQYTKTRYEYRRYSIRLSLAYRYTHDPAYTGQCRSVFVRRFPVSQDSCGIWQRHPEKALHKG